MTNDASELTQLKVAFLNCDKLTIPKLDAIKSYFSEKDVDIMALAEVGPFKFRSLEEDGWYLTEKPLDRKNTIIF